MLPDSFAGGRYLVQRHCGEGSRKEVLVALDVRLGREVAIAWLRVSALGEEERERFHREVQALGRLTGHPHIVTVLDAGEEAARPYLVTEYMGDASLARRLDLAPERRLEPPEALRVARQLADALAYAHACGVLHRDLKPANVWFDRAGGLKLGDFGLALFMDRPRLTTSGTVVGTPHYMAPEQALGQALGPAVDIYALGALLYEMLTGRPPFLGDTALAVVSQHLHAPPVAPSWYVHALRPEIDRLVLRLLAKSAAERPVDAQAVAIAIDTLSADPARTASPPTDRERNPLDRLERGQLVGRADEVTRIGAGVEEAIRGRGGTTLLAGDAGIGKTRLALELTTYARMRGARSLVGRCHEGGAAPAFWPFTQILRALVEEAGSELLEHAGPESLRALAQIVPERVDETAAAPSPPAHADDSGARFRFFDALARLLVLASRERPLFVVVDDLHWADGPSASLLEFLAREIESARIRLLVTYRDTEVEPQGALARCLGSLRRAPGAQQLYLRGLRSEDVRSMIEAAGAGGLPDALLRRIVDDSEGNPFFVEELVRSALEDGHEHDPRWSGVPESVQQVIVRRLGRLSSACRQVLQVAAVIGREFDLSVLERAATVGRGELLALLDEAEAARVVVATRAGALAPRRFEHALTRETLYGQLRTSVCVALHRSVGEALEDLSATVAEPPLAELAHHFYMAAAGGDAERALVWAERAGESAASRLAFEEAALHYERAFELLGNLGVAQGRRRCDVLLALGEVHHRAGERDAARQAFVHAAAHARELRSHDRGVAAVALGRAALGLGGTWGTAGVAEQSLIDLLEEAVSVQSGDSPLHARLLARLAVAYYWSSHIERRLALCALARAMAERLGDPTTTVYVLDAAHFVLWQPERIEERCAIADALVEASARHRDPATDPGAGHFWRLIDALECGDIASVDRDLEAYSRLAERWREPNFLWYARIARGMRAMLAGRLDEAERLMGEGLVLGERVQGENAGHFFGIQLLELSRLREDIDGVIPPVQDFVQRFPSIAAWRAALAALYAAKGNAAAARVELDTLAARGLTALPRDANFLVIGTFLAEACSFLRDEARAATLLEMLAPFAAHNGAIGNAAVFLGSISHALGLLACVLGRAGDAHAYFEQALAMHQRMGARPYEVRTRVAYAQALIDASEPMTPERRARARELLEGALECATELGLDRMGARARALLERARGPSPAAAARHTTSALGQGDAVWSQEGEYWTIGWQSEVFRLKDSLGLHYLARLLANPGQEFHCSELFADAGVSAATSPSAYRNDQEALRMPDDDAGELLDARAKQAYRSHLRELREELAEAERLNDKGRIERMRTEIAFVESEILRAVGLGGRDRRAASRKERARLNVTRAIRAVMQRIDAESPTLTAHLVATVKTGTFCSYTPDPRIPLTWSI